MKRKSAKIVGFKLMACAGGDGGPVKDGGQRSSNQREGERIGEWEKE